MPEIYECFYGLAELTKFFTQEDKTFLKKLQEFEEKTEEEMAKNRLKLYTDYGYTNEFDQVYI